jgi:hypothetical protein
MRRDALTFVLCATLVACGGRAELLDFGDAADGADASDAAPPAEDAAPIDGGTEGAADAMVVIDAVADDSSIDATLTDALVSDDSSIDAAPIDATLADAADSMPPDDSSPPIDAADSMAPEDSSPPIDAADSMPPEDASSPIDAGPDAADAGACTFAFAASGSLIGSANVSGVQNIPAGVTPSGSALLIQRGGAVSACTSNLSLYIADETPAGSGIYQTLYVYPPAGMDTGYEENVTLTADGLTIVGLATGDTRFVASTRSATGLTDFGPASAGSFAQIVATGSETLWAPVVSPDGLAFYYTVHGDSSASVNGIYESVRASTSLPFPPGTRMPAAVQNLAQYVTALTPDRLTIFLEESTVWGTVALTRATVADAFTNPLAPDPPPSLPGLRAKPIDGCGSVIATCGSGCVNEEVCLWAAP